LATVIDSLLIELGLDTSKFDAAQKKSVEQLRKFDEANQKTQKNLQKTSKDTAEGFEKARDSLISFGTAAFSVAGFTGFINSMTTTNAALGRNASLFNMSVRELDAWGGVLKSVGGTADDFQASIQALQTGVANVQLGNPALLSAIGQLSARSGVGFQGAINYEKNTVDIYRLADAFKKLKDLGKEEIGLSLAAQLGINKNTFFVLENGSAVVHKLYDESYKLSGVNEKNVEQAKKLQNEFGNLSNAFSGTKNSIMDGLYPALHDMFKTLEFGMESFTKFNDSTDHWASNIIVLSGAILTLDKAMKVLGVTATSGVWVAAGRVFATLALLLHSKEVGESPEELEALRKENQANAGKKGTNSQILMDYFQSQGWSKAQAAGIVGNLMQESSLNPNAKNSLGMLGIAQWNKTRQADFKNWAGFGLDDPRADLMKQAQFVQYELNHKESAAGNALKSAMDYLSSSNVMFASYERAGDNSAGARAKWASQYYNMAGANANLANNGNGTSNVTSNVQNLNVYTNTNDPNKMLNDIERAAQNNPIIASGMAGAR